jgi:hypothetical protein
MHARHGGAWLTADFIEVALGDKATVDKPESPGDLRSILPDEVIHSMQTLDGFERKRGVKVVKVWGVRELEGFAGPASGVLNKLPGPKENSSDADVVVLDDAGNGFRDLENERVWPSALFADKKPIILYKVRRPLLKGKLWDRLVRGKHLDRTIAMLRADEFRGEGAQISRHLSWERTVADLLLALCYDNTFKPLTQCKHLIVTMSLEGVLHLYHEGGAPRARLWYVPDLIEGDLLHDRRRGGMTGFSSVFAAAVSAAVVEEIADPGQAKDVLPTVKAVQKGISDGMLAARYLFDLAYGETDQSPAYPKSEVFNPPTLLEFEIHQVDLPPIPDRTKTHAMSAFRNWRILDAGRKRSIRELAKAVALRGLKDALPEVPVARFGDLETIDRWEIESYRSIRNMFREYLRNPRPERPLCIAVFGRPGSGKSFGVTEVAKSVTEKDPIERIDFNLSQWKSPEELVVALHRVRDHGLRGRVPLVFFDEFDSSFDSELGWLKYFLAPMNDGVFSDGHFTHQIGPAIFVFAGGTCSSFQSFRDQTEGSSPDVKAPDFLSRLRGTVDVFGPDPLADTRMLSRAMILRRAFQKRAARLFDGSKTLRIHTSALVAFLNVSEYRHGARSIEAIVEMSQLQDREQFDPSLLPPPLQMRLHVDPEEFLRILHWASFEKDLEEIAPAIHEQFVKGLLAVETDPVEKEKVRAQPGRELWENLSEFYRESNRDQAAHIPSKLAAVGCDLVPIRPGDPPDDFAFTGPEVETLAQMEHARWVAEREQKQPEHPDLKSWEDLQQASKDKDIRHVKGLPEILRAAGRRIIRLR